MKHRIVGIVILIALAVIFLPFLFQHNVSMNPHAQKESNVAVKQRADSQQNIALKPNLAAAPATHFQTAPVTRVVVHQSQQRSAASAPVKAASASKKTTHQVAHHTTTPNKPAHHSIVQPAAKAAHKAKPTHVRKTHAVSKPPKLTLPSLPKGWLVQIGSFSNKANADHMVQKLRKKGFTAYVHEQHHGHTVIRAVQVGPAINRAKAEQLRKKLYQAFKLKGYLIKYNV